jgi:hypothetical protein
MNSSSSKKKKSGKRKLHEENDTNDVTNDYATNGDTNGDDNNFEQTAAEADTNADNAATPVKMNNKMRKLEKKLRLQAENPTDQRSTNNGKVVRSVRLDAGDGDDAPQQPTTNDGTNDDDDDNAAATDDARKQSRADAKKAKKEKKLAKTLRKEEKKRKRDSKALGDYEPKEWNVDAAATAGDNNDNDNDNDDDAQTAQRSAAANEEASTTKTAAVVDAKLISYDPASAEQQYPPFGTFDQLKKRVPQWLFQSACGSFKAPTPVQACTWPLAFANQEVIGVARTGSGKVRFAPRFNGRSRLSVFHHPPLDTVVRAACTGALFVGENETDAAVSAGARAGADARAGVADQRGRRARRRGGARRRCAARQRDVCLRRRRQEAAATRAALGDVCRCYARPPARSGQRGRRRSVARRGSIRRRCVECYLIILLNRNLCRRNRCLSSMKLIACSIWALVFMN